MTSTDDSNDSVKIYAPDRSLQIKIGVPNLDKVFTPAALEAAQSVITNSSDSFLNDGLVQMDALKQAFQALRDNPSQDSAALGKVIDASFAIKTDMGLGGYTLIASLAKSLQLHAEQAKQRGLSAKTMELLKWHLDGVQQCLNLRIKGTGGATGEAILKEIERLDEIRDDNHTRL